MLNLNQQDIILYSVWAGGILFLFVQILIIALYQRSKYKKLEDNLMKNAIQLVEKMDIIEEKITNTGENNMDKDIKKLASYLSGKINAAKEEIIEKIDSLVEETEESKEDSDESDDDFDSMEDYDGDRKISFDDAMEDIEDSKKKKKKK